MRLPVLRYASCSPDKHVTFYVHEQFAISYSIIFIFMSILIFFVFWCQIFEIIFVLCPPIVLQRKQKYDFYKAEVETANKAVSQWLLWQWVLGVDLPSRSWNRPYNYLTLSKPLAVNSNSTTSSQSTSGRISLGWKTTYRITNHLHLPFSHQTRLSASGGRWVPPSDGRISDH